MKISWIGPWVGRINWCEGHWCGLTYLVVRVSNIYFVRFLGNGVSRKNGFKIYWPSSVLHTYLFKTWLREISFGKFMTILCLWYFITKAFKNSTGGRDNFSAIAVAIIKSTKTLLVQTMSDPSSWIQISDNTPVYYILLYMSGLFYNNQMHFLMTF